MGLNKNIDSEEYWKKLDNLIEKGLRKVSEKLIEEEKKKDGYLIISDKNGNPIKVPAKDL
jgi:hypothetical protein